MQKACVLFILFVCVNCAVVAQLPGLSNAYGALMEESFTKFNGISGKDLETPNNYKRVESTYKINNASSCYIETSGIDTYWYAEYDTCNNPDEAGLKLKKLQTEFMQSFRNYHL